MNWHSHPTACSVVSVCPMQTNKLATSLEVWPRTQQAYPMGWPLLSTHVCDVKLTSCLCGYLRALSQDKLEKQIDPVVCKAEDLASQLLQPAGCKQEG